MENSLFSQFYQGLSDDQKHNRFYAVQQLARFYQQKLTGESLEICRWMAEKGYDEGERIGLDGGLQ